jgi:hypothetical protein
VPVFQHARTNVRTVIEVKSHFQSNLTFPDYPPGTQVREQTFGGPHIFQVGCGGVEGPGGVVKNKKKDKKKAEVNIKYFF